MLTSFLVCTGIEEIGVQIEEPFSILALGVLTFPCEWGVALNSSCLTHSLQHIVYCTCVMPVLD